MGDPVVKVFGVDQVKGQGPTVSNISAGIPRKYTELMKKLMDAGSPEDFARLLREVSLDPQDTDAAKMLEAVKGALSDMSDEDEVNAIKAYWRASQAEGKKDLATAFSKPQLSLRAQGQAEEKKELPAAAIEGYSRAAELAGRAGDRSMMLIAILDIERLRLGIRVIQDPSSDQKKIDFALENIVATLDTNSLQQVLSLTPKDKREMVLQSLSFLLTEELNSPELLEEDKASYRQMLQLVTAVPKSKND